METTISLYTRNISFLVWFLDGGWCVYGLSLNSRPWSQDCLFLVVALSEHGYFLLCSHLKLLVVSTETNFPGNLQEIEITRGK